MAPTPHRPVRRRILTGAAGVAATVTASLLAAGGVGGGPAAGVTVSENLTIGTARNMSVQFRGNGHGHGMSQYGARGAARAGLT